MRARSPREEEKSRSTEGRPIKFWSPNFLVDFVNRRPAGEDPNRRGDKQTPLEDLRSVVVRRLTVFDREIPIETIVRSLRDRFLLNRSRALPQKLTDQVVTAAFKKVTDEEGAG